MQLSEIDLDLGQIVFRDHLCELVDRDDIDKGLGELLGSTAGRLLHEGSAQAGTNDVVGFGKSVYSARPGK